VNEIACPRHFSGKTSRAVGASPSIKMADLILSPSVSALVPAIFIAGDKSGVIGETSASLICDHLTWTHNDVTSNLRSLIPLYR
jgi:hypothetical protein